MACIPSRLDARSTEIDVLGVTFVLKARSQQCYDMHAGHTAIAGQIAYLRGVTHLLRHASDKLADDVAQAVDLLLADNLARDPIRILNVLVSMQRVPDCVGAGPTGFQRLTVKTRESRRGSSSKIASVGLFDRMPPSQ